MSGFAVQIRRHQRDRRLRHQMFAPVRFREQPWDMLLELYASQLEERRVSVSGVTAIAIGPETTGLRALEALTAAGFVDRAPDPADGRRIWLSLTSAGASRMAVFFDAIAQDVRGPSIAASCIRCEDLARRLAAIGAIVRGAA